MLLLFAGAGLILLALALFVALPVRRELLAAEAIVSQSVGDVQDDDIANALGHLRAANDRLGGPAPAVLRLIPVARQNINAIDELVDASISSLEQARRVSSAVSVLEDQDLVSGGKISIPAIEALREPVARQADTLSSLRDAIEQGRSGWLLPPVWDALDDLSTTVASLSDAARRSDDALSILGPMLGSQGRRTYLVLLLNNAELRGAGGILSGFGSLTVDDGDLALGDFSYYGRLAEDPPRRVEAPPDFEARFARYFANSTELVNASASPDVPDVALVARELYRLTAGRETDGAIVVDPRGLEALLPPDGDVPLKGGVLIPAPELDEFVYSESYEQLGFRSRRRSAVLDLGEAAFKTIVESGVGGRSALEAAGTAVSGGHLRIVSFDPEEQEILADAGVSGELTTDTVDKSLVTVQNLGGDKLDFWMRRSIAHDCQLDATGARCTTIVRLRNKTPLGLHPYVVQGNKPYGHYFGWLELYVPEEAELLRVVKDDTPVEFFREHEDGWTSVGFEFDVPRNKSIEAEITYDLPLQGHYSLKVLPQPLPHDAQLAVHLTAPEGWEWEGQGSGSQSSVTYEGPLDGALEWTAQPIERRGLAALWESLKEFWNEPLF